MKKFLIQITFFALPLLMGTIMLFTMNPDKQFSYRFVKGECNNKASWIYERVFLSDEKLDVVFIGASQTACAVNDCIIEARMQEQTGKNLKIASLGYCRGGRDIQYIMLKEVFRQKKPGIVIIEVTEDEPKKSHPVFPYLAETSDLVKSAIFFNQRYIQNLWKGLIIRFEYLKAVIFNCNPVSLVSLSGFGYIPTNAVASEETFLRNREAWNRRLIKNKSKVLRNIEIHYSKHYLEKMINLANVNESRVVFLYLRESGSQLVKPMLYDYYMNFSNIIILPEEIVINPDNWSDATHFNDSGANLASEHISNELTMLIFNQLTERN